MKKLIITAALIGAAIMVKSQTVSNVPLKDIDAKYIQIMAETLVSQEIII